MVLNVLILVYLAAYVTVVTAKDTGVAVIEQLREQQNVFNITFVLNSTQEPVKSYASYTLPDQWSVTWKIHDLPLLMGSESCSELELGSCFKCVPEEDDTIDDNNRNPWIGYPICIEGNKLLRTGSALEKCARILGKYGVVGRSVVVRVLKGSNQKEEVYCANIYNAENQDTLNPKFLSTIAWFDRPLTGFVAFRKESQDKSYILVNLTRTVDNNKRSDDHEDKDEGLKWEIRTEISGRDYLFNPGHVEYDTTDSSYNSKCDPKSNSGHQSCAAGDLWKKHGRLQLTKLKNDLNINLKMYVDHNLDSITLETKYLVILNTTNEANGSNEIVAWSKIEDLQPISTEVWFLDRSVLKMYQRDDWSPIEHSYEPANLNTPGKWVVTVYKVPPIQIFGGDQWDCDEITSQGWSASHLLPPFKTSREGGHLNQSYTLYGRNSMLYHGVAVSEESTTSSKCATITYKQGEERIAYSLLETTEADRVVDQRVMVLFVQHKVLRQTTVMLATLCSSNQFFLELTESPVCKAEPYNPYGVCPAYCPQPLGGVSCVRKCPTGDPKWNYDCCTMCVYNSSFLCPVGDLRRRLDVFRSANRMHYRNRETVFSVKNEVNLPLDQIIKNYIGLHIYNDPPHRVLTQCGVVEELTDTVVTIDDKNGIKGGSVTLSQTAAWQPITVSWRDIELVSLKFWEEPDFSASVCTGNGYKKNLLYQDNKFMSDDGTQVRTSKTLKKEPKSPTFFGKHSVIGRSLTVEYKAKDGAREETTLNIRPTSWSTNATQNLQAVLQLGSQRMLKIDLEQLKEHYTADTYVTVEVLSKKYCKEEVKWYIVTAESAKKFNYKAGDNFVVDAYEDKRLLQDTNSQERSCSVPNPQYPANLRMGDLSGILLDMKLDGPGRIYVHEFLPLLEGNSTQNIRATRKNRLTQVQGNYVLLADRNNTILGLVELKQAPRTDTLLPEPTIDDPASNRLVLICVCAAFGAIVIIIGTAMLCKCTVFSKGDGKQAPYDKLTPDPHSRPNEPVKTAMNKRSGRMVYVYTVDKKLFKLKTEDAGTGDITYEHHDDLLPVNKESPRLIRYVESNGSTNGSSLTRSRGTVAEENVYTTVSPTAGHPNTMGSVIASPDSSSSSLSSRY